ncbi:MULTISPECIES: AAA family ATPase [unclassified Microcystis]|uniref:AAA family ATPase n=1 Tax=Microcystis sp. TaxID=1127 RepID=UPI0022C05902|nr:ATP-binding protein [Microcystis sp. LE17-20D]MCZ8067784.1 ATP-binding protein [Microcystis sp. LE17-20D]MCZ8161731.1 ATP-binding protein [Microcystis sp. LE19-196.1B]MCZ8276259.1 ATP-binding protein [Microcystis sp. LE19-4.1E]
MLIGFSVGNYRSFKDVVTLSMVAAEDACSNDELDKNNVFKVNQQFSLLKSAAIYGANASGKSNLILAFNFMRRFVMNSAKLQITDKIDVEPFRLSTETVDKPSFFEVVFQLKNKTYRYGFEVTQKRVVSEWLFCTPRSRETKIFNRQDDKIEYSKNIEQGNILRGLTKKNTLFLSLAAQFNNSLAVEIVSWFSHLGVVSWLNVEFLKEITLEYLSDRQDLIDDVTKLIKKLDLSIDNLEIESRKISLDSLLQDLPDVVRNIISDSSGEIKSATIKTYHPKYDSTGKMIELEIFGMDNHESDGTKKILALSAPILDTLQRGEVLVIDELDARLHPLMTRSIIELFNSQKTNPKNAQLIFTTHDINLLSHKFLRRDQIWFTEKNHQGATDLYSLVEFADINNNTFDKDYIQGRYGAIPFIGDLSTIIGN